MAIDYEKLSRLEDSHARLLGARHAMFERYTQRLNAAKEHLAWAVRNAHAEVRHLGIEQLAQYTDSDLDALGVRMDEFKQARREYAAAARLFAEIEAGRQAISVSLRLVEALRKHAFPFETSNSVMGV